MAVTALPLTELRAKRAKEIVDVIPDMPTYSTRQCRSLLTTLRGADLSAEEFQYSAEGLLIKSIDVAMASSQVRLLPAPLCPRATCPEGTQMSMSLMAAPDGTTTVMKVFCNKNPLSPGTAKQICHGAPQLWDYKRASNSDLMRKAITHMVLHAKGHHWLHMTLRQRMQRAGSGELSTASSSGHDKNKWNPSPEQLKAGIAYINYTHVHTLVTCS